MRKLLRLSKTLLVAAGLLVGVNSAWADATVIYGRSVTADLENGYTAWSASDIGSGNWGGNAYFQEGEGIKMSGQGSRNTSKSFTITENAILTIDFSFNTGTNTGNANNYTTYSIGEDIQIWFNQQNQQGKVIINGSENAISNACVKNQNRNNDLWTIHMEINTGNDKLTAMTLSGRDGTNKASFTLAEAVTLSHNITTSITASIHIDRSAGDLNTCLTSMRIQEEKQAVTNVGYTINYKLAEEVVKTVSTTSIVGAVITADVAVDGEGTYAGNHYLITAAEAPSMTLVADAASNVLNVPVRAPYTATLNVTRTIGGVAQSPVVTNLTETDAKVCSWVYTYPMYVQKDGVYYVADETASFGESGNFTDGQTINKTVAYTNPDYSVVYYGEPNEVAGTNTSYSNGNVGYIKGGVVYSSNDVIRLGQLAAGTYRLITKVTADEKRNVVVGDYTVGTESFPTALVTITTTGAKDETFTVDGTQLICISGKDQGNGKFNQSATLDYILVKASTQKKAITSAGWATLYTEYPLDFSGVAGLTAYTATYNTSTKKVELTEVDDVQANTGVVLKGAEKTYDIPVIASSETLKGELKGAATATAYDAYAGYDLYMLSKNGDNAQFKKVTSGSIAAGKAFLMIEQSGSAPTLDIDFGDATAIEVVKNAETKGMGEFYNLAGQRVAQPTKGLYIVNGKKVVIK